MKHENPRPLRQIVIEYREIARSLRQGGDHEPGARRLEKLGRALVLRNRASLRNALRDEAAVLARRGAGEPADRLVLATARDRIRRSLHRERRIEHALGFVAAVVTIVPAMLS